MMEFIRYDPWFYRGIAFVFFFTILSVFVGVPALTVLFMAFGLFTVSILRLAKAYDNLKELRRLFTAMSNKYNADVNQINKFASDIKYFFQYTQAVQGTSFMEYSSNSDRATFRVNFEKYQTYCDVTFIGNGIFLYKQNEYQDIKEFIKVVSDMNDIRSGKAFV